MIEKMTRGKVVALTGATEKTLRVYEDDGLLRPTRDERSGYLCYSAEDVLRVFDILVYREVGYGKKQIEAIFESPDYDWEKSLKNQRDAIQRKIERLNKQMGLVNFFLAMEGHDDERQQRFDTFAFLVKYPEFRWILGLFEDKESAVYHETKMDAALAMLNCLPSFTINPDELPSKELTKEGLIMTFDYFDERFDTFFREAHSEISDVLPSAIGALITLLAICSEFLDYASEEVQELISHGVDRIRSQYSRDTLALLKEWAALTESNALDTSVINDDVAYVRKFQKYAGKAILHWLAENGTTTS